MENPVLKTVTSLEGTALMLDDTTPHVAMPVQVVIPSSDRGGEPRVVATTLTDQRGEYRFVNLKPGVYRVRCQVLDGLIYYGAEEGSSPGGRLLSLREDQSLKNIDFRLAPFKKGTWKHYYYFDGLVDNSVYDIHREPDGRMWFAAQGGVSCYDGRRFVNFTTEDGLTDYYVYAIHASPDGALWFSTKGGGVSRYHGERFVNFTTADGLPSNRVSAIHCDLDGTLWFGTEKGLVHYNGQTFQTLTIKEGLEEYNSIWAIHRSPDGRLWFGGGGGGVSCYDGKTVKTFTPEDGLVGHYVNAIASDQEGNLWIGTRGSGVSRYDGKTFVNFTTADGLPSNRVLAIHCDPEGVLWFGTADGMSRYDGKTFVNFTTEDGLATQPIYCIYTDPDGILWVATGGGLCRYDRCTWVNLTTRDGLAPLIRESAPNKQTALVHYHVSAIHPDARGRLWFATMGGGVSCYDGERFVNFTTADGLPSNTITAVYEDRQGNLWFGARDGGVSCYNGERFVHFTPADGLHNNLITALHGDPDGNLWIGLSDAGIVRYDGKRFEHVPLEAGSPRPRVNTLYCDQEGILWVGTLERGVFRYDGQHFENLTTREGLASNDIRTIYCGPDGSLWFGTLGGGVSRYDGQRFENLTTQDGLAGNHVLSVYHEPDGDLWIGTSSGVSRYDGTTWMSMDKRDGLAGNNIFDIYRAPDGTMLLATDGGVTRYQEDPTPPRAYLVAVTTDRRYTDLKTLKPVPVGMRITFEYSAIDFKTEPHKRRYRYKLDGYDAKWSRPTGKTQVDYTNLAVGDYTFQVQAIDRDLNYSEPAVVTVTVQPDPRDIRLTSLQTEVDHLRQQMGRKYHFENIVGRSVTIQQVFDLMEDAIDSGLTVLISGETGTGKELVAKAIHYHSSRKGKPLLELNCGAVPKDLLASTLFGYRKGAFTGAQESTPGLFEAAAGGTVLLDEIGEMSEEAQVHLLRVLQERKVQRLGEFRLREVDVRILTTTNRNLAADVEAGRFREDLFYRLNVFPIVLPVLRERTEDIPLLTQHFLRQACAQPGKEVDGFGAGVIEMLETYPWPGNVRELKNEIDRATALVEEGHPLQTHHFSARVNRTETVVQAVLSQQTGYTEALNQFRRQLVEQVLEKCAGNRSAAARRLQMDRSNLIGLIRRLGLEDQPARRS